MSLINLINSMILILVSFLGITGTSIAAQPVIISGVVADEMTKQSILQKARAVYGEQVVDRIQVKSRVSTPVGWTESVSRAIQPELKKVSQGKLKVQGTQLELSGKVQTQLDILPVTSAVQSQLQNPYLLKTALLVQEGEQKIVDDALADRIVEFESGSAILTESGMQILNEMATALNRVKNKNIRITGHTDSSGNLQKNNQLSLERANTVKTYLISRNIAAVRLSTVGVGAAQPVADNTTPDGRKKNRRIQFEVL